LKIVQKIKKYFVLTFLLSILIIISNTSDVFAKNTAGKLTLKDSILNLSSLDLSRNDLVIENASGFNHKVLIKPEKVTNNNGRGVHILGVLKDGELHVDLSNLGAANELKRGLYRVVAKRKGQVLQAQVTLNPPTLFLHNLSVLSSSINTNSDVKINCQTYIANKAGATIGKTFQFLGSVDGNKISSKVFFEVPADYSESDVQLKAQVLIDNKPLIILSRISFIKNRDQNNIVSGDINNATTVSTPIYIAIRPFLINKSQPSVRVVNENKYLKAQTDELNIDTLLAFLDKVVETFTVTLPADLPAENLAKAAKDAVSSSALSSDISSAISDAGVQSLGFTDSTSTNNLVTAIVDSINPNQFTAVVPQQDTTVSATGEQPTTPAADQPTTPAADQPTTPAADQPTTPAADQSTTPATDQSTTPAADQSTETPAPLAT